MSKRAVRPGYETEQALLDAAERLLVDVGEAGITTRQVAAAAGAIRFLEGAGARGTVELLVSVLERFT